MCLVAQGGSFSSPCHHRAHEHFSCKITEFGWDMMKSSLTILLQSMDCHCAGDIADLVVFGVWERPVPHHLHLALYQPRELKKIARILQGITIFKGCVPLGLPLKRLLQLFPVLRMCGKDLPKPTAFSLLKKHPTKPKQLCCGWSPLLFCEPLTQKTLWSLLKSIPGDSKMCFKEQGPALPYFWDAQAPHPWGWGERMVGGTEVPCWRTRPSSHSWFCSKTPKTLKAKGRGGGCPGLVPHGWKGSLQPWSHWRYKLGDVSHSSLCHTL